MKIQTNRHYNKLLRKIFVSSSHLIPQSFKAFLEKRNTLTESYLRNLKKQKKSFILDISFIRESGFTKKQIVLYNFCLYVIYFFILFANLQKPFLSSSFSALVFSLITFYLLSALQIAAEHKKLLEELPLVLDIITRRLKTGGSLYQSFVSVTENWQGLWNKEFSRIMDEINSSIPLSTALKNSSQRIKLEDYRFFCSILTIQQRRGGKMALVLEEMGNILRAKQGIRKKTKTLSSQSLSSARFIIVAPLVLLGLILYNKPENLQYILHHPIGQKLLLIGGSMYALGIILIKIFSRVKV